MTYILKISSLVYCNVAIVSHCKRVSRIAIQAMHCGHLWNIHECVWIQESLTLIWIPFAYFGQYLWEKVWKRSPLTISVRESLKKITADNICERKFEKDHRWQYLWEKVWKRSPLTISVRESLKKITADNICERKFEKDHRWLVVDLRSIHWCHFLLVNTIHYMLYTIHYTPYCMRQKTLTWVFC